MKKFKTIVWDREPISKQGIYSKISLQNYHSAAICDGPSVSSSGLRLLFSKSPAHFYSGWPGNPDYVASEDKEAFVVGRAVHMLCLGEQFFDRLFCIQPSEYPASKSGEMKPWNNNSIYAKVWREQRLKEGKAILTQANVENIVGMAESLGHHEIVKLGALNGQIERSIFWKDKPTGLWLKSRPDAIPTSSVDFVDLKTTQSVIWNDMQRTIAENGYHQQGALIRSAARAVLGIDKISFTLIFVEKTRPWCVRCVEVKDVDLDRGERQNRRALDTIARCIQSKRWPGPGGDRDTVEFIELPEWAQKQIDDKLELGL